MLRCVKGKAPNSKLQDPNKHQVTRTNYSTVNLKTVNGKPLNLSDIIGRGQMAIVFLSRKNRIYEEAEKSEGFDGPGHICFLPDQQLHPKDTRIHLAAGAGSIV